MNIQEHLSPARTFLLQLTAPAENRTGFPPNADIYAAGTCRSEQTHRDETTPTRGAEDKVIHPFDRQLLSEEDGALFR